MLSEMGCEKFQLSAGSLFQFAVDGGDEFFFVLPEDRIATLPSASDR